MIAIVEDSLEILKAFLETVMRRAKTKTKEPPTPRFWTSYKPKAEWKKQPMNPIIRDGKQDLKYVAQRITPYTEHLLKIVGWTAPKQSLENGAWPYRSRQMTVSVKKAVQLAGKKTLRVFPTDLETEADGKISVDAAMFDDRTCIVSVIKQKEALPLGFETVRKRLEYWVS